MTVNREEDEPSSSWRETCEQEAIQIGTVFKKTERASQVTTSISLF